VQIAALKFCAQRAEDAQSRENTRVQRQYERVARKIFSAFLCKQNCARKLQHHHAGTRMDAAFQPH
jgi:hypothetical protein